MYRGFLCIALLSLALPANAAWQVVNGLGVDSHRKARVARIENADGYILEIYRKDNTVRSRFRLRNGFAELAPHMCPTYQVDTRQPVNESVDDKACTTSGRWAEFVLGYVKGHTVKSLALHRLINGESVTYRFALAHGGYRQTKFSLKGSSHAIREALLHLRIEAH